MKAIKGFEVHVAGRRVKYAAGADVPDEICKEYRCVEKRLVSSSDGGAGCLPSDTPKKPAKRDKLTNVSAKPKVQG